MNLTKNAPFRSKRFLKFCHEETEKTSCCMPRCNRIWSELHHFGDDGGKGMKPSDNEVARLCSLCHRDNDFKRRALIKNGYLEILETFQNDALKLNRKYIEFLESKES